MLRSILILTVLFLASFAASFLGISDSCIFTESILIIGHFKLMTFQVILLIGIFDLFFLYSIGKREQRHSGNILDVSHKHLRGIINYSLLILFGGLTILTIRFLYSQANIQIDFASLLDIGLKELLWLVIFLNIFLSFTLISIYLMLGVDRLGLVLKEKLLFISMPLAVYSVLSFYVYDSYIIIPVLLSFLIFIFVLDLFLDKKVVNSTWILTWMILVPGFTTLIIYTGNTESSYKHRKALIKQSLYSQNDNDKNTIKRFSGVDTTYSGAYIEKRILNKKELVFILNQGYYNVDTALFFNPLNGYYLKLLSPDIEGKRDSIAINHLYNTVGKIVPYSSSRNKNLRLVLFLNGKVINNNTNFGRILKPDSIEYVDDIFEYSHKGNSFLWYRYSEDIDVLQVESIPNILMPFSLFSLLFLITGLIFLMVSVLNQRISFLPSIVSLTFKGMNSLRNRIQMSIIGLIVASFFILGIITFFYFKGFSEKKIKESTLSYSENIQNALWQIESSSDTKAIQDILEQFEYDNSVNIYYLDDSMNVVKNPRKKIYTDELKALQNIDKDVLLDDGQEHNTHFINVDGLLMTVTGLDFQDDTRGFVVFVNPKSSSNFLASGVLSNFLNVYVILFLLAGAIAITLANSISKPIDILGKKLELLDISGKNEMLNWKNEDEVGKLIAIYNKTVVKLEESAKIITKIERDSAWRDMAKQVAHEIKNPLTPLKLNIQYLQSFVKRSPERAGEMVEQISDSLIEQINNLDKIATEFSDFAKMPSARNEKVILNEIVERVHDFFRKREDYDIKLYVPINDLVVFADNNHLVSILNNIIKNAIQAIPNDREGQIIIDLYKEGRNAIIKITDNGIGIPSEMVNKVFSPNFTTKSSGTGLGLAISANMIQAFNGKIYFETKENEGTSFFVEIPLMKIKDNFGSAKRVMLD